MACHNVLNRPSWEIPIFANIVLVSSIVTGIVNSARMVVSRCLDTAEILQIVWTTG